jgi:hypothetical protein
MHVTYISVTLCCDSSLNDSVARMVQIISDFIAARLESWG